MPTPVMTHVAQATYGRLGQALTAPDEEYGWTLAKLNSTLIDPLDDLHALHRDGWARIVNPATTPSAWLPWLAQIAGVDLPAETTEDAARQMITNPVGWLAGTPAALTTIVAATLTGTKTVKIEEHYQDDPWAIKVTTYEPETPDPAASEAAAQSAIEAGFKLIYQMAKGWTFNELAVTGITYAELARIKCDVITLSVPGTTREQLREHMQ